MNTVEDIYEDLFYIMVENEFEIDKHLSEETITVVFDNLIEFFLANGSYNKVTILQDIIDERE